MERNVGSFECAGRFVLGCGLLIAALHTHAWLGWVALAVLLSASGRCPLWWALRIDTTACDQPTSGAERLQRSTRLHARSSPPGAASVRRHSRYTQEG